MKATTTAATTATAATYARKGQAIVIRGTSTLTDILSQYGKISEGVTSVTLDITLDNSMRMDAVPARAEACDNMQALKGLTKDEAKALLDAQALVKAFADKAKECARKRLSGQTRQVWVSVGTACKTSDR